MLKWRYEQQTLLTWLWRNKISGKHHIEPSMQVSCKYSSAFYLSIQVTAITHWCLEVSYELKFCNSNLFTTNVKIKRPKWATILRRSGEFYRSSDKGFFQKSDVVQYLLGFVETMDLVDKENGFSLEESFFILGLTDDISNIICLGTCGWQCHKPCAGLFAAVGYDVCQGGLKEQ